MVNKEVWNYPGNNPEWETNYICWIDKDGWWQQEKMSGKWLFFIEKKEGLKTNKFTNKQYPYPNVPTMADQNNFMSGLLECDWHNDTFKFPNGETRCSSHGHSPTYEFLKRLKIFQETLSFYKTKYNGQTKINQYLEEND